MVKKLTKHGNSLALIIDKPLLEILNINEKSALEISIVNGALVVKAVTKKKKKNEEEIDEIANRIMDRYESVFKKLAKT